MDRRPKRLKAALGRAFLQADWLNRGRALAYCRILGVYGWGLFLSIIVVSHWGTDFEGQPICADFVSFWAASRQVLQGHVAEVYDSAKHHLVELSAFPGLSFGNFAFYYPPTFLLVCVPLAVVPYRVSVALFLILTGTLFVRALRRLLPQRWALLPILAFPGLVIGVANGQNGLLTGSLFGWAMVLLAEHPFVAGLCLGGLVIKPQLLVAAPVVLLCAGRWRAVAGGICSGLGLIAASWLAFGAAGWNGFLRMSHEAQGAFSHGYVQSWKMQSVFAAAHLLHAPAWLAYGAQITAAVSALSLAGWLAAYLRRRVADLDERMVASGQVAVMIAAMPFCSPFLLDYDLACLAFPMGWLLLQAQRTGWWSGEKFILFLAYIYLLGARLFAELTHVGPTPIICAALLCVLARRIAPDKWSDLKQIIVSKTNRFSRRHPEAAPVATRSSGGVQA
ncbi:MAG: glycosyltransferase family 87 protein [Acetobacter sp.]|uniref:glycosyltransferase family 87 protein n=1 Tax=Acetobacter sp. TaxID=440 RepID=UPI0039EAD14D